MKWRVVDTAPAPGAWNMAVDEALMESVREDGMPVLRFYQWSPRCLSLGRNQPAAGRYCLDKLRQRGMEVVRRPTGGRAVLHDRELTYSAVFPEGALGSPRTSYATINRALLAGLRRLGVPAEMQPRTRQRAPVPSLAPCFRDPAEGEVVVGGRKLVGSAQYREAGVVLQHGSLLLAGDQSEVGQVLCEPSAELDEAPAVLEEFCRPLPTWTALTAALREGWREVVSGAMEIQEISAKESDRAVELRGKYAGLAWTWRR